MSPGLLSLLSPIVDEFSQLSFNDTPFPLLRALSGVTDENEHRQDNGATPRENTDPLIDLGNTPTLELSQRRGHRFRFLIPEKLLFSCTGKAYAIPEPKTRAGFRCYEDRGI